MVAAVHGFGMAMDGDGDGDGVVDTNLPVIGPLDRMRTKTT